MGKTSLSKLNELLPTKYVLICFCSFESRSTVIAQHLNPKRIKRNFILRNIDAGMKEANEENYIKIANQIKLSETVEVSIENPVKLSKGILKIIDKLVESDEKDVVVDITTFTHESLLIMLRGIQRKIDKFDNVLFVYNPSQKYADWLSKGCKEIRNVMGYPGFSNPINKDHMIILTGFEKERATQLVEEFEPDYLSIGNGVEPTNINHQCKMDSFKEEFEKWFNNLSIRWNPFTFSCSNIESSINSLETLIDNIPYKERNIQIVPLNTKLSSIATGIIAINNPNIQVIYPIPEAYNIQYAKPSEDAIVLDLKELLLRTIKKTKELEKNEDNKTLFPF